MTVHAGRLLEVAVAVGDVAVASDHFTHFLRAPISAPVEGPDTFALRFTMCRVGRADFEIMESMRPDGLIARFVARQGEGLHHIAFEIDDAEAAMRELRAQGAPVLGDAPVRIANLKAFFLHPSGFGGILVEFVQNLHPWLDGVSYRPGSAPRGIDARRIVGVTATVADVDAVAAAFATIGAAPARDAASRWLDGVARACRIGDIDLTLVGAAPGGPIGLRHVTIEVDDVDASVARLAAWGAHVRRHPERGGPGRAAFVEHPALHRVPVELVAAGG